MNRQYQPFFSSRRRLSVLEIAGILLVIALLGLTGTMDKNDQELAEAYQAGFQDGQRVSYARAADPDKENARSNTVASKLQIAEVR